MKYIGLGYAIGWIPWFLVAAILVLAVSCKVQSGEECTWTTPIDREDARACASIPNDSWGNYNRMCLERLGYRQQCVKAKDK